MKYLGQLVTHCHLEVSSKCALACPKCARVAKGEFAPEFITYEDIKRIFPPHLLPLEFLLCGTYGDPIYNPELHSIVEYLKSYGSTIEFHTNGFGRSEAWWDKLVSLMTAEDRITFSIDGLADTNHLYRIGSNWDSIMIGVRAATGRIQTDWKFIPFKHNEHQIDEARKLAKELGFDEFTLQFSHLYSGKDDPLRPSSEGHVSPRIKPCSADVIKIVPRCKEGKRIYVTSGKLFFPCCASHWGANHKGGWFAKHADKLDLTKHSLQDIIADSIWEQLEKLWEDNGPPICSSACGRTTDTLTDGFNDLHTRSHDKTIF